MLWAAAYDSPDYYYNVLGEGDDCDANPSTRSRNKLNTLKLSRLESRLQRR
jgi:hypothetical protein